MKNKLPHVSFETLADMAETRAVDNRQPSEERGETLMHLSSCIECATSLQKLRQAINLMKSDREPDAPRDVLAYAVNLFGQRAKTIRPSRIRRLVAALTFDSAASTTPAFGFRSGQSASRQMLYSADDHEVELRLSMQADEWTVAGQVLSEGCEGAQVSLMNMAASDIAEPASGVLNQLCEFSFSSVPPGSYKLQLRLSDVEVEVPQFELKA